jgi:hypothetical protein
MYILELNIALKILLDMDFFIPGMGEFEPLKNH